MCQKNIRIKKNNISNPPPIIINFDNVSKTSKAVFNVAILYKIYRELDPVQGKCYFCVIVVEV
jgi:hypothetical protein